jgi:uncharacterized surface protein with fasciclin (FAS1) repeats
MKSKSLLLAAMAITTSSGLLYADNHKDGQGEKKDAAAADAKDIVTIASEAEDFSTLVAAVKAAGLVEVLKGDGPFTVFAPTNAAFAALPEGTVADLMKPENKEKLATILTYHVVAGKLMAKDVAAGKVKSVQGSELTITVDGGTVMVDTAKVTKTDIVGSNGVIHVIDKVIMPKAE